VFTSTPRRFAADLGGVLIPVARGSRDPETGAAPWTIHLSGPKGRALKTWPGYSL